MKKFTKRYDKNGKKIYDGSIVSFLSPETERIKKWRLGNAEGDLGIIEKSKDKRFGGWIIHIYSVYGGEGIEVLKNRENLYVLGDSSNIEDMKIFKIKKFKQKIDLKDFSKILSAIIEKKIDYGQGKTYCFFLTEDKTLHFLKNNKKIKSFPRNEYDGQEIWSADVDRNTTEMFFEALNIFYKG